MYKVFIEDKWIVFAEEAPNAGVEAIELHPELGVKAQVEKALQSDPGVWISGNYENKFRAFKREHEFIEAAGGFILDDESRSLWILRHAIWDLPKGKLDPGETAGKAAIREVQEETGLMQMEILQDLPSTYHCYEHKGKQVLKKTYWYLMKADSAQPLAPQLEEGIEKVEWVAKEDLATVIDATYASVRDLLLSFLEARLQP